MESLEDADKGFSDLGLKSWIVENCSTIGLKRPTPVQMNCIPKILSGCDVFACAKTGSGKTVAFVLPIVDKLAEDIYGIYVLVVTPTRELALQIADQFRIVGKFINISVSVIIGGLDRIKQTHEILLKPHVVVGTPGRLADLINSNENVRFNRIKFLVLDEVDRLLVDNFSGSLSCILNAVGDAKQRQTLLFSATITDTLKKMQALSSRKPFYYISNEEESTVEKLEEYFVLARSRFKDAYLFRILIDYLTENANGSVIVFVRTCEYCQILYLIGLKLNLSCVCLHSFLTQKERINTLNKFKSSQVRLLFATDVASRGLDIPMVNLIINHNVPAIPKLYIHRVGRTARAGRSGTAITLVTEFDSERIHKIETKIKKSLSEYEIDDAKVVEIIPEVAALRTEVKLDLEEHDFGEDRRNFKKKIT